MKQVTRIGDLRNNESVTTLADLKVKLVEHVMAQADFYKPDEVWSILAETKVGAWRRSDLLEKIKLIFSLSPRLT